MDDLDLEKLQNAAASGNTSSLLAGFSVWTLFFGFAFGVLGWWIFKQARKKQNFALIGIGLALMIYPYFVTSPWGCFLVGSALCFGAYVIWNR